MDLETIRKHKLELQNDIKNAVQKFEHATEGVDVYLDEAKFVAGIHGGIITKDVEVKLSFGV